MIDRLWPQGTLARADIEGLFALRKQVRAPEGPILRAVLGAEACIVGATRSSHGLQSCLG